MEIQPNITYNNLTGLNDKALSGVVYFVNQKAG